MPRRRYVETIGEWSPGRLATFIRNLVIDPGVLPRAISLNSLQTGTLVAKKGEISGHIRALGVDIVAGGESSPREDHKLRFMTTHDNEEVAAIYGVHLVGDDQLYLQNIALDSNNSRLEMRTQSEDGKAQWVLTGRTSTSTESAKIEGYNDEAAGGGPEAQIHVSARTETRLFLDHLSQSEFLQLATIENWKLRHVSVSHNLGSKAAHTGGSETFDFGAGANLLAVGDLIVGGPYAADVADLRSFLIKVEPVVTTADQIQATVFNTDSGVRDPATTTFHFYVLNLS